MSLTFELVDCVQQITLPNVCVLGEGGEAHPIEKSKRTKKLSIGKLLLPSCPELEPWSFPAFGL